MGNLISTQVFYRFIFAEPLESVLECITGNQ